MSFFVFMKDHVLTLAEVLGLSSDITRDYSDMMRVLR